MSHSHYSSSSYLSRYLPQCHDYALVNAEVQCEDPAFLKFTASVRVAWRDKTDMKKWVNEFSKLTRSDWIQRDMSDWKSFKYSGAFSGKFVCQHSSHGKKEDSVRDSNCRSEIFFNFVRDPGARKRRKVGDLTAGELAMRKSDVDLWRKGLRYLIRINFIHSHNLESADGLKMLRSKVDDIYYALFTAGIEPMESYEIFQRMNRECFQDPINKANASLNPDIEHVQYLHKRYIGAFVPADYDSQLKAIESALIDHYESSGVTVIFSREPLVVAVATPLMQRAAQLGSCADVIFVDSTPAYDTHNHFVTFLFTSTSAGAIPIGCFITRDLCQSSLQEGLNLLKGHFGANGLGGGTPRCFVVIEELEALRMALAAVWPGSSTHVNRFQKMQAFWKWLLSPAAHIRPEDCGACMHLFKRLLNSGDVGEAERLYGEALSLPIAAISQYPQYLERLRSEWGNRKSWCAAYRDQPRGAKEYACLLSEASVRSYREVFENRRPAATLIGLITKIIAECNAHYSERLMNSALGRNSEQGRQAHSIVRNCSANSALGMAGNEQLGSGSVCLVSDGVGEDGVEVRHLVNVSAGVCECSVSQTMFHCQHLEAAQTHLSCHDEKPSTSELGGATADILPPSSSLPHPT